MIELFKTPNYDFIGKRKWAYYVSIAFTLLSLGSLVARGGLRYDIDFTGGTLMQARFEGARSNLTWASVPPVKSMSYRSPPCATIDAMPMRVMVIETM